MKRTLLTLIAALLLGGAAIAQNHWDAPDSHAKSSNTPIVASVTIDGQPVTLTADYRLGAFVGDELRGLAAPYTEEEGNFEDSNFWIQVFYDYAPNTSEDITFKLYDGTTEYASCSVTKATQEAGWGTPTNPVVLDFATTQTQSITLVDGWNWWATNIELNNNNGLEQLENGLGLSCIIIKSREDGNMEPLDLGEDILWIGDLATIYNEQMYMIQTNAACNVTISGQRASLSNHLITIKPGWNWIGYPNSTSIELPYALSGLNPEDGDQIKGRTSFADYIADLELWLGDLVNLEPGQGYMYNSNSTNTKTFYYQTGRNEITAPNSHQLANILVPTVDNYAQNMTIIAAVEIDGQELREDNYEIAAFVDGECRGSAKIRYYEPLDRYMAFLLAFGDATEDMSFLLTDGNTTSWSNDHIRYASDSKSGSSTNPTILHFGNIDEQVVVNVYPNPSKNVFNVESHNIKKFEIVNLYGQIVVSEEVSGDQLQIDLSKMSAGPYMLRVITDDGITSRQLIKE